MLKQVARIVAVAALAVVVVSGYLAWRHVSSRPALPAPRVNVRWVPGIDGPARRTLEREYSLESREHSGPRTFSYEIGDPSRENIAALLSDPGVEDTHHIDRALFAPTDLPVHPPVPWLRLVAAAAGIVTRVLILIAALAAAMSIVRRIEPLSLGRRVVLMASDSLAWGAKRLRAGLARESTVVVALGLLPAGLFCGLALAVASATLGGPDLWLAGDYTVPELAALGDRATLLKRLQRGADLDARDSVRAGILVEESREMTPLEAAVEANRRRVVAFLVDNGASLTSPELVELACRAHALGYAEVLEGLGPYDVPKAEDCTP